MYRIPAFTLTCLCFFASATAAAEEPAHAPSNVLGVRVIGGAVDTHHHRDGVLGVGVSGEHAFFDHLMELELVASYLMHGEHSGLDGEFVVNFPWSPNATFDFYAGGGGMVEYDGHHVAPGVLVDVGSRAWATEHFGLGVEVDLVHVFNESQSNAVEGIVAALYRF